MSLTPDNSDARLKWTGDAEVVRDVFEAVPVMLLGMTGPEHRVVAVNTAYRAGVRRRQIIGVPIAEVFPEFGGQQIFEMLDRVYETGAPQIAREWRIHIEPEDTPGQIEEIFFDFTASPWFGSDGTLVGLTLYAEDVTDRVGQRRLAEQQFVEAQRRYEQAREVITTLQQQLLPPGLPVLPRVRLAASYLLADAENTGGGDWYDAVRLPDGRVGLVVGDVVGHGVTASATMGQLRAILEDRLAESGDIRTALAAVDRLTERLPLARAATVCIVTLDPTDGSLVYCTAGHPPPLVITADGQSRYLPVTGTGPLGTGTSFMLGHDRIAEGDLVLLYSDGILERPGRDHRSSTVELARVAADAVAERVPFRTELPTVERVSLLPVELLVRASGHTDDITLLAAQRVAPPDPLRRAWPANLATISTAHKAVAGWLAQLGTGREDIEALQHAVGELVTNAVMHAYIDATNPGTVHLDAELFPDGMLRIDVTDTGRWHEHPPGLSGREGGLGLVLTEAMVESVHLESDDQGTVATITHHPTRPARLLNAEPTEASIQAAADPDLLLVLEQHHTAVPRVRIDGPITEVTVGHLAAELQRRTRNGTRPLTLDLTGITLLASVGVAALHHAVARSAEHDQALRIYAPVGSTADHVLTLVAVPHTTVDPHSA